MKTYIFGSFELLFKILLSIWIPHVGFHFRHIYIYIYTIWQMTTSIATYRSAFEVFISEYINTGSLGHEKRILSV